METAKAKAMQLFNSFEADLMEADVYYLDYAKKRCALIAVDELINNEYQLADKLLNIIHDNKIKLISSFPTQDYWQEVKTEINKL